MGWCIWRFNVSLTAPGKYPTCRIVKCVPAKFSVDKIYGNRCSWFHKRWPQAFRGSFMAQEVPSRRNMSIMEQLGYECVSCYSLAKLRRCVLLSSQYVQKSKSYPGQRKHGPNPESSNLREFNGATHDKVTRPQIPYYQLATWLLTALCRWMIHNV